MAEEIKTLLSFKNLIKTNSDIKCDYQKPNPLSFRYGDEKVV